MTTLRCEIVTPENLLFSEEVYFVSVPAAEGDLGVLTKRSPVVSTLRSGEIRIRREESGEALRFAVAGGYVESDGDKIVVLATRATEIGSLALDAVRSDRLEAEKKLAALSETDAQLPFFRDELAWYTLLETLLTRA
jgi:F-type H+-transporting ATPase subunit epsilon